MLGTRRRLSRLAFALLIGLALAGIAYVAEEQRFPARAERLPGTSVELRVQDGVPEADVALVRDGIVLVDRYLEAKLGGGVAEPVEARVAAADPCEPFAPRGSGGWAEPGLLCVDTHSEGWRWLMRRDRLSGLALPAHEHVHNLQHELGCAPDPDEHQYRWLTEGMAMHVAWQALVDAGRASDAAVEQRIRAWGAFDPDLRRLGRYETPGPSGDREYALWHLAVRTLMVNRQPLALRAFCARAGAGTPWKTAFRAAFGLPVERFYREFERSRRIRVLNGGRQAG